MNDNSAKPGDEHVAIHERLGDLCTTFHQLQNELLNQADAEKGAILLQVAVTLIA